MFVDRAGAVCLVDWAVGRLMKVIEDRGRQGNTLVIVMSDNGASMIFADGGEVTAHRPDGDCGGQKGDLWDGGYRVRFMAAWPGYIPAGRKAVFAPGSGGGFSEPSISNRELYLTMQEIGADESSGLPFGVPR